MDKIFRPYIRKTVECYMGDIAVKNCLHTDHLIDLREVFDVMRQHQLKINPTKSFLGVATGKFLGSSSILKESPSTPRRLRLFKTCYVLAISRNSGGYKAV